MNQLFPFLFFLGGAHAISVKSIELLKPLAHNLGVCLFTVWLTFMKQGGCLQCSLKTYGASCTLNINSQDLVAHTYTNHHSTTMQSPFASFSTQKRPLLQPLPHGPVIPNNPPNQNRKTTIQEAPTTTDRHPPDAHRGDNSMRRKLDPGLLIATAGTVASMMAATTAMVLLLASKELVK